MKELDICHIELGETNTMMGVYMIIMDEINDISLEILDNLEGEL